MTRQHPVRGLTLIELLVVLAIIGVLIGLLLPAVQRIRDSGYRVKCANNLRQMGQALHQYHQSYSVFPPGVSYQDGKAPYPFMSWSARLLPYLEQQALWEETVRAYGQDPIFQRNPPHRGLTTVLSVFCCPADTRTLEVADLFGFRVALTSYLGVEGTNQRLQDGVLFLDSAVRLADITDGTTNTLLVGERPPSADRALGWWYAGSGQDFDGSADVVLGARERNYNVMPCPFGPSQYGPGRVSNPCDALHFWSLHVGGGAHFLLADSSVHFLRYDAAPLLPALATRAGGEAVSLPE